VESWSNTARTAAGPSAGSVHLWAVPMARDRSIICARVVSTTGDDSANNWAAVVLSRKLFFSAQSYSSCPNA
jgi:hypothetical protein